MALLVSGRQTRDFHIEQGSLRVITGDKAQSEETINNVALFILKNCSGEMCGISRTTIQSLTYKNLSYDQIKLGKRIIEEHSLVKVVPDEINKDPNSTHIFFTREITIGINDESLLSLVSEEGLAVLRASERTEVTFIGVATFVWKTIQRYEQYLAAQTYQPVYVNPPHAAYVYQQLTPPIPEPRIHYYQEPHKSESCCCSMM